MFEISEGHRMWLSRFSYRGYAMIRAFFVLLMSVGLLGFVTPASAVTVNLVPGVTTQTVDPDSIGDDVTYDWSYSIGAGGSVSWGIFDTAGVGSLSFNVGATALPGSNWSQLELVTFDVFGNFMNTTGVLDVSSIAASGGYTWNLDFSQVDDQAYTAFFWDAGFNPATGPGFFGLTAYDPQTVVPPPSPVPLPAGVWLMLTGLAFLFRRKIFAPAGRLVESFRYSPSRIPAAGRMITT
tara:strand:+ start:1595 stop:2308 length:714 start_codon:yes stop_codon:yes gene_type:complete